MEQISWSKGKTDKDRVDLQQITEQAAAKLGTIPDGPSLSALDETNNTYIKNRFQKTNEDDLRNDLAEKVIIEGPDTFDKTRELTELGEKTLTARAEKLETMRNGLVEEQRRLKALHQELEQRKAEAKSLSEQIKILNIKVGIYNSFNLNKSDTITAEDMVILNEIKTLEQRRTSLLAEIAEKETLYIRAEGAHELSVRDYHQMNTSNEPFDHTEN